MERSEVESQIAAGALQAAARAAERAYWSWKPPPGKHLLVVTDEELRQHRHQRWVATVAAAAPYLVAEGRQVTVYLVIGDRGIFGAYLDYDRAVEVARYVEGVLVALPITEDFRRGA